MTESGTGLVNGSLRKRRYTTRSRTGCVTCRQRRKRCFGGPPECDACQRLNLRCIWAAKKNISSPNPIRPRNNTTTWANQDMAESLGALDTTSFSFSPSPVPQDRVMLDDKIDQRIIMSYYINSLIPNISVANVPSNFFTSAYIPLAFHCEAVRSAVLACASAHLSQSVTDSTRRSQLVQFSSRHKDQCQQFLHKRMSMSNCAQHDAVELMAAMLMLVALEVMNGTCTSTWMDQMSQLSNIIRQQGGESVLCASSWEARNIYPLFLYYDVMSFIMSGVVELEEHSLPYGEEDHLLNLVDEVEASWENWITTESPGLPADNLKNTPSNKLDMIDPLLGLSTDLFRTMQKIRDVQRIDENREFFDPAQLQIFKNLESEILNIQFSMPLTFESSPHKMDAGTRLDLLTLAEINRLTALILLYRRSTMHKSRQSELSYQLISLVDRIPLGSSTEAGLTYPLFLAGAQLSDKEEITRCANRLIGIRNRVKVMNILSAEKVLEEVWRERLNGGPQWDWEHVLRKWNWVLNLA